MGPELFGVGALEALLVLVIAMVVVGPQRLPEIARQSGRWYRVARRYTSEITADLRGALNELEEDVKADTEDLHSIREIEDDLDGIADQARPTDVDAPSTPTRVEQNRMSTSTTSPVADTDEVIEDSESSTTNTKSHPNETNS